MPRREVILRDDGDGGKRRHEVELRTWKVTAPSGISITFEAESWFAARQRGRTEFLTENVTVEEVDAPIPVEKVAEVLEMLADGASESFVISRQLAEEVMPDVVKAFDAIDQGAKAVVFDRVLSQKEVGTVLEYIGKKYNIPIESVPDTSQSVAETKVPDLKLVDAVTKTTDRELESLRTTTALERLKNRAKGR